MGSRTDLKLWITGAAVLFAASGFSGISIGLEAYSPGPLALYAAFARMRLPKAGDLPALALMGFPVFGAFTVFLGCGQLTVPASTASLLIATIPAFMALWWWRSSRGAARGGRLGGGGR